MQRNHTKKMKCIGMPWLSFEYVGVDRFRLRQLPPLVKLHSLLKQRLGLCHRGA